MFLSLVFYNVYWALIHCIWSRSRKTIPFPRFGIYRKMSSRFYKLIGKTVERLRCLKCKTSLQDCSLPFSHFLALSPFLRTIFPLSLLMPLYLGFSRTLPYISIFLLVVLQKSHRFKPQGLMSTQIFPGRQALPAPFQRWELSVLGRAKDKRR